MTTSQGFSLTEVLVSLCLISTTVLGLMAEQSDSTQMLSGLARKNLQHIETLNQYEINLPELTQKLYTYE